MMPCRLAHQHPALTDGGDDRQRLVARIVRVTPAAPRPSCHAHEAGTFEMRHEADIAVLSWRCEPAIGPATRRIAQTKRGRQAKQPPCGGL